MTLLSDVVPPDLLEHALTERLIVRRVHPTCPLAILNYTERCQYERGNWNAATTVCRGLIYRADTNEVLARPFRKFFNYGQAEAPQLDPTASVIVTDKLDGSLGILYPTNGGWAVATRGSFDSEQALHATAVFRERYVAYKPPAGVTVLFEIVFPDNRIVIDYGATDDLILLGGVEIGSGRTLRPDDTALDWPGHHATVFPYTTLADAISAPPRPNAEGLVIHFPVTDERVKVKQEDYVALHRIVTGLNERTIWEHLSAEKPLDELLASLPDEFHDWVRSVADRLTETVWSQANEIEQAYAVTLAILPAEWTRKDYALAVASLPLKWALFMRLDGKDYKPQLWKLAKPEPRRGPHGIAQTEDTA